MAMITVCDLCRQEIKDNEPEQYVFPNHVINDYSSFLSSKKQWWNTCCMELCEDCRMKVVNALKDIVKLEKHIGREKSDEL